MNQEQPEKKEKQMQKENKEPVKVDIAEISKLDNCELWEKKVVNFNHHKISVVSYALIYKGDPQRKLCFNTYDGTLGKKSTEPLPIDAFLTNQTGQTKLTWHQVKDITKERAALQKKGYERITTQDEQNASTESQD